METKSVEDHVLYEVAGSVATIALNRPNKLNALYPAMLRRMRSLVEKVAEDNTIRALVLRGHGRAFCAGDDLSPEDRFKYGPPDRETRMRNGFQRVALDLMNLRKPVVCIVQGYALGAGFDLALACDFRIAEPKARMGSPYVKRGLGGGSTFLLPKFVGLGKATELLLLGEFIEMEEALRLGLVTRVVPDHELSDTAYDLARKLAEGPTQAIGAIKIARNEGLGSSPQKGFEYQTLANVELMFHKDARIGPRAFSEGKEPEFTNEWIDLQYGDVRPYE